MHIFFETDFFGKLVLLLLFSSSIYIWSVIVKKIIFFSKLQSNGGEFVDFIKRSINIKRLVVDEPTLYFELHDELFDLYVNHSYVANKKDRSQEISDRIFKQWEVQMENQLDYLGIIGSISPFVGLFGTVWGIMNSFQSIALSNSSSIAVVAPGISEALFATAIGLAVAIPANIATHLFYSKIEQIKKDYELFHSFMINKLEAQNEKK